MDALVAILNDLAERDGDRPSYTLTNTSRIIRVEAAGREVFDTPGPAFAAAQELVGRIVAAGFTVVNSASIGTTAEPLSDEGKWRGTVRVAVWDSNFLERDHHVVQGITG